MALPQIFLYLIRHTLFKYLITGIAMNLSFDIFMMLHEKNWFELKQKLRLIIKHSIDDSSANWEIKLINMIPSISPQYCGVVLYLVSMC